MSGTFEKNSLGWQVHLLQQQFGEWFERLLNSAQAPSGKLPNWSVPDWVFRLVFWAIAIALIVWFGWRLYRLLSPYLFTTLFPGRERSKSVAKPVSAESVPEARWIVRSRTYAQQGNYRAACQALYMAVLQQLDDRKILPGDRSRTDGEYLRFLQTQPNPRPYHVLFRTHERSCFGEVDISEAQFIDCEQAYRETETP
ncbi:DUF4129 domain-containing protein [Leptolyngbyaceae cyanobacterium UHCC 1019]